MTVGCNTTPLQFCPGYSIGEWETLVWMAKAPTTPAGGKFWAAYHPVPRGSIYTLRDEQNRVVTEMIGPTALDSTSATLNVSRDNAFLGSLMVASYSSNAWTYSASDHLGSPRVVWNSSGQLVESHKYWPYGEDTNTTPPNQRLSFALMERDTESQHFYDHARHHHYGLGRFVSTDKLGGKQRDPQSWNRYTYSRSNPLRLVDRNGLYWELPSSDPQRDYIRNAAIQFVMRPSGRQAFVAIAIDPLRVELSSTRFQENINRAQRTIERTRTGTNTNVEARTSGVPGGGALKVQIDVQQVNDDSSKTTGKELGRIDAGGITTFGHETGHVLDALFGGPDFDKGDDPSNEKGRAAAFGQAIFDEEPDIDYDSAAAIVDSFVNVEPACQDFCQY